MVSGRDQFRRLSKRDASGKSLRLAVVGVPHTCCSSGAGARSCRSIAPVANTRFVVDVVYAEMYLMTRRGAGKKRALGWSVAIARNGTYAEHTSRVPFDHGKMSGGYPAKGYTCVLTCRCNPYLKSSLYKRRFRNAAVACCSPSLSHFLSTGRSSPSLSALFLSLSPAVKGDARRRAPSEGQRLVEAHHRLRAAGGPLARNPYPKEAQGVGAEQLLYGASMGRGAAVAVGGG